MTETGDDEDAMTKTGDDKDGALLR